MTGYFALDPRPIAPDDAASARALLVGALGVTPYVDHAIELLELAERGGDTECRALVIERDGTIAALALFGLVAGTEGAGELHLAVVDAGVSVADVGGRLMDAVEAAALEWGARFLIAEMPDDPAIGAVLALLREHGFHEEGRIPDYYRDGVALAILRRPLSR